MAVQNFSTIYAFEFRKQQVNPDSQGNWLFDWCLYLCLCNFSFSNM